MKFIHLADLHIGKRVNGFSMLEDQQYILRRILEIAEKERPDGVLIAGDIYDKNIPSEEAVGTLDDFLAEMIRIVPHIYLISGNHDSAERVSFGGRIMEASGIHIAPLYDGRITPYYLEKGDEKLAIWLLPYIRPAEVRRFHEEVAVGDYQGAMQAVLGTIQPDPSLCNIAVVHQFITGGAVSESEENVGTLENVDVELFAAFDYVALGHLHGPQQIGRESVRYAGSPLKYSFSEWKQKKSVTILETEGKNIMIREEALVPLRDMQVIDGFFAELTDSEFIGKLNTEDYFRIILRDEQDVINAGAILRSYYPRWMSLEYQNARTAVGDIEIASQVEGKTPLAIFAELFEQQNNRGMSEEQQQFLEEMIRELTEDGMTEEERE